MKLEFSLTQGLPGQAETEINVMGDTITIDGVAYDLSPVPEGGQAIPEGESPFIGKITRQGGNIACTVLVRLGPDAAPDQGTEPLIIENASGDLALPVKRKEALE